MHFRRLDFLNKMKNSTTNYLKQNRKRIALILSALGIVILFLLSAAFTLGSQEELKGEITVNDVNENRSQVLVTGKNYTLNYEQEQKHREEIAREEKHNEEKQQRVEEQREQIETPEEAQSIVEREETRREERRDNPPEETPAQETDQRPTDNSNDTSDDGQTQENDSQQQSSDNTENNDNNPDDVDENPQNQNNDNSNDDNQDSQQDTPTDHPGDSGSNNDEPGDGDGNNPGPSDNEDEGDGSDGTGGDDNAGDGGEGGDNPTENPDEPDDVNKNPIIECSLSDGVTTSTELRFTLRGVDYRGRAIDSFNYKAWVNGSQVYSSGTEGGYAVYRSTLPEGRYEVTVYVVDGEGNDSSVTYTAYAEGAPVAEGGQVYLTIDMTSIGHGIALETVEDIYEGQSVASFVDTALKQNGLTPYWRSGWYLERIGGVYVDVDNITIPEEYQGSEYLDGQDPYSLGEKDVVATSGWLYYLNGAFMEVGMGGVTLMDGDEVELYFTLGL